MVLECRYARGLGLGIDKRECVLDGTAGFETRSSVVLHTWLWRGAARVCQDVGVVGVRGRIACGECAATRLVEDAHVVRGRAGVECES